MFGICCPASLSGSVVEKIDDVVLHVPPCVSYDPTVRNVTYVSDVEGQWDYFCNFVNHSKGLNFVVNAEPEERRTAEHLELHLEEGWHFVYGGDACDKGPGTLRFLEAMVRLKKTCPGRVHLLLGNGDVNRLGLATQLSKAEIGHPKDATVTLWAQAGPYEATAEEFEYRRVELAHLRGVAQEEVLDKEVVRNYTDNSWLREYLQRSQLGVLLGETLFVDGQVIANGAPGEHEEGVGGGGDGKVLEVGPNDKELQTWLKRLNAWGYEKLKDLESRSDWDPIPRPR